MRHVSKLNIHDWFALIKRDRLNSRANSFLLDRAYLGALFIPYDVIVKQTGQYNVYGS